MEEIPRVKHELSAAEKMMVVRCHHYFKREKDEGCAGSQRKVRQRVDECLGVAESTVARIVAHWNAHHDSGYTSEPHPRGRPPLSYPANLVTTIRAIVNERNREVLPTTVNIIADEVKKRLGEKYPSRTINRVMERNKFRFGRGKLRHYSADNAGIVAYRDQYLRKRLENHDRKGNPRTPEIYLDESYCNLNHVARRVWIDAQHNGGVHYERGGVGPRLCIVGAGIVRAERDILRGEWIAGSFVCWDSKKRTRNNEDYHGNFDHQKFERWFSTMCETAAQNYGACHICMDGARYHKRRLNPQPTAAWKKMEIANWLTDHNILVDSAWRKAELVVLARQHKEPPRYASVEIARSHGHSVFFTSPYHPELQPIELIWGVLKNKIAYCPAASMATLKDKVIETHNEVTSNIWIGAWRAVREQEKEYQELEDETELPLSGELECSSDSEYSDSAFT